MSQELNSKKEFWTLRLEFPSGTLPERSVTLHSRPNVKIEETDPDENGVRHLNEGSVKWENITTTFFNANEETVGPLYKILAAIYDLTDEPKEKGVGTLTLLDGCGNFLETWIMRGLSPVNINFGEGYSEDEDVMVELTWAYDSVEYKNNKIMLNLT